MATIERRLRDVERRVAARHDPDRWRWGIVLVEVYQDDSEGFVQELIDTERLRKFGSLPHEPRTDVGISSVVVVMPFDRDSNEAREQEECLKND